MKKFLAFILCVILLASFPLRSAPAHAITPGLMITGSTIINSAAMTAILSIVAQTMGIDGNIKQGMEAAQQNAVTTYLGGLLSEYATRVGSTVGVFYTIINEGMKYASNGALTFDEAASQFLGDFFEWAHSEEGGNLVQYDDPVIDGQVSIDYSDVNTSQVGDFSYNANIYVSSSGGMYRPSDGKSSSLFTCSGTSETYLLFMGNRIFAVSENPCTLVISQGELGGSTGTFSSNPVSDYGITYYYARSSYGFNVSNYYPVPAVSGNGNIWQTCYMIFNGQITGSSNVDTNIFDFPSSNPDNYDTNVIYPGDIISLPDFGSGDTGTADIGSYLGAVSDVIYSGAGSLSVEDSQGVTTDYSVSSSGVESMQHVQAASATVDQVVGGSTTAVGSGTVGGELGAYTLDLRDFFPFCIPFDIYRMLSLFAASREAPHVEWRFLVPGIVDETIEIDLSVFDTVAATLRSVELIAAAIGLALITKRLIQGGD